MHNRTPMNPLLRTAAQLIFTIIIVLFFGLTLCAQENTPEQNADAWAAQTLKKLDKDENGQFEKSENPRAWRRFRKLDTNNDKALSLDELRQQPMDQLAKVTPVYLETGGVRKLDVVYKSVGETELMLDLYYPADAQLDAKVQYPLILYTHGGGWAAGSKHGIARGLFKSVFLELHKQGFAVASVQYRLCKPESSVTMRDCVIDCKDAARYLAQNGETLRLDPNLFFVMGDSAGGHLAQMLLLTPPEILLGDEALSSQTFRINSGVSWYGPCDFENMQLFNHNDRPNFRDRFGPRILGDQKDPEKKQELYREMSPINYLNENSPPLLMIQGDKDTTIPVKHAYHMKEKADNIGAPVETMIIQNAGHNWRSVEAPIAPTKEAIRNRTVQFFVDSLESLKEAG